MDQSDSERGTAALTYVRDLLEFLRSLWGTLAAVSLFFPLSNVLVSVIPLNKFGADEQHYNGGGIVSLPAVLFTTLATITTLFMMLLIITRREDIRRSARSTVQRKAIQSFALGLAAVALYLVIFTLSATLNNVLQYDVRGIFSDWQNARADVMIGNSLVLLVIYCAIFSLITGGFMLLGLIEYLGVKPDRQE